MNLKNLLLSNTTASFFCLFSIMSLLHDYELDAPSNDSACVDEMNNGSKIECKNDERSNFAKIIYSTVVCFFFNLDFAAEL